MELRLVTTKASLSHGPHCLGEGKATGSKNEFLVTPEERGVKREGYLLKHVFTELL